MTREAKQNIWFLAGFLVLSLPGVVMLVKKKMAPEARSMAEASYVRRSEVYNNPLPAGSKTVRVVPPATFAWVEALTADRLGRPAPRHEAAGGRREPIMSDGRRFEVVGFEGGPDEAVLVLLAWSSEFGEGQVSELHAESEQLGIATAVEIEGTKVPPFVVTELRDAGLVIPPGKVGLVRLGFAPKTSMKDVAQALRVRLRWSTGQFSHEDELELPMPLLEP